MPSSHHSDLSIEVVANAPTQRDKDDSHLGVVSSVHKNTTDDNNEKTETNEPVCLGKPPVQSVTPLPSTPHATSASVNHTNTNKFTINVTVVRTNSTKPFKTSRPTTPLLSHANVPYGSVSNDDNNDNDDQSLFTPLPSSTYANS